MKVYRKALFVFAMSSLVGCTQGAFSAEVLGEQQHVATRVRWEQFPSLTGIPCSFEQVTRARASQLASAVHESKYYYLVWARVLSNIVLKPEHANIIYQSASFSITFDERLRSATIGAGFMGSYSRHDQAIPIIVASQSRIEKIVCEAVSDL